jgi:hypothetical protein
MCHGLDGHTPSDAGRWMYPRASDLTAPEVQQYSDGELFWILKNGIRLSGMPAFGRVESDEHIWNLSNYLRLSGAALLPGLPSNETGDDEDCPIKSIHSSQSDQEIRSCIEYTEHKAEHENFGRRR